MEITRTGPAPTAEDGALRIGDHYRIEADIRGLDRAARLSARQDRSAPIISDFEAWLAQHRARAARKSPLGEALADIAKYRNGLCLSLTIGRIELGSNTVERTIQPIALNWKNALIAGHDAGTENWAVIASLIETYKLNAVDPYAWLTTTLTVIAGSHMQSNIADPMPWSHADKV